MPESTRTATQTRPSAAATFMRILPYAGIVLCGYLAIGVPIAVLPLQVHDYLGFDTVTTGLIVGLQAMVAILVRPTAGKFCDQRGAKAAAFFGAALCAAAAIFYWLSASARLDATTALAFLALGRVVLGLGDALILTGTLSWAIGAVGPQHSGKVMVWVGIAMFAALSIGAPLGLTLQHVGGFTAVAWAAVVPPLVGCLIAAALPHIAPVGGTRIPFLRVLRLILPYGAGLGLATLGFSAIAAFIALDFQAKAWSGAGYAVTAFGGAYIVARLFFGHLPDRHGGRGIALVALIIEFFGQLMMWQAWSATSAIAAAALSGAGISLVFPALGVEAVKHLPPQSRGAGMGAYIAFFDLGFGLGGPIMGMVAAGFGYPAVFLAGALGSLAGLAFVIRRPSAARP
jgi:MFS family permease